MNQAFIVSNLEDENDGDFSAGDLSLREAIAQAESDSTITFDQSLSGGTIDLSLGELAVDKSLTIDGLGAENIIIDGGGSDNKTRVINIDDNSDTESKVVINDLTITGGNTVFSGSNNEVDGAGILNKENLEINNAIVRDNSAETSGGGISSEGTLTVNNSAIYNNTAQRLAGGGIFNTGTATINQSTISSNTDGGLRGGNGGGIGNTEGTLNVNNSTVTENRSSGIGNSGGEVTLTSTIVAENSGNNDIEGDDFISGGNNFIGGESGSFEVTSAGGFTNGENGDIVAPADVETTDNSIDPQLGELQDNGGATPTQALQEGSPAIDAGSNTNNLETDQRGEGFNRTVGNGTDIGAYEVQENSGGQTPTDLIVSTLVDENDGNFSAGDLSLREAIAQAKSDSTITFDSNLSGGTITLSQGELTIDKSLTINGLGAKNLIIDGNNKSGIFLVDDGNSDSVADVSIDGLTIANGNKREGSGLDIAGGGFLNQENLTIADTALVGNKAGNGGAIYNTETGNLQLNNSLVTKSDGTGPIYNDGGSASISNTTIANNNVDGIGAIVNDRGAELGVTNSTITNNNSFDAAVFNSEDSAANFGSTIIAGNTGEVEPGQDNIIGAFDSSGGNLIGNTKGGSGFNNPNDLVGTADNPIDPLLSELQDNDGLTQTIALQAGSPAIDAGKNFFNLATDQRGEGFDRTVGNAGELGGSDGTDIGAYEVQEAVSNPATDGNDTLIGTNGNDLISGLGGNDLILGKDGHDSLYGNNGKDIIFGDAGDDLISGGKGNDLLFGGEGNDTIDGGAGKDIIFGGGGNNTIVDSSGKDIIIDNLKDGMLINGQEIGSFLESYDHDLFSSNNFDVQGSIAEVASNSDLLCF